MDEVKPVDAAPRPAPWIAPGAASTTAADRRHLHIAIEDSQILLRYAAEAGIFVPEAVIAALVHARASDRMPEAAVVAFYAALTTLAAKVHPVTVSTLTLSERRTRHSLRWNGAMAMTLAGVVVLISGITFSTASMTNDIDLGITHANDLAVRLRNQVGAPDPAHPEDLNCYVVGRSMQDGLADPATSPDRVPQPDKIITVPLDQFTLITELQDFASTIRTLLTTSSKLNFFVNYHETSPLDAKSGDWFEHPHDKLYLESGLSNMHRETFCKIDTYQEVRNFAQCVRADTFSIYGAISAYLLPVLYALLGAFAYNLRDFSERVRRRTYHPSSYANTARTIAAMTVGAIISLFNIFNKDTTLQPLAIAFLVGYGVEFFFSFLDTMLETFSTRGRNAAEPGQSTPAP